jgi:hypothetical protein
MPEAADTVYNRRPWELTSQTLELNRREDADVEPQWIPPVPVAMDPYEMVPPAYGYRTEELGIDDILDNVGSKLQSSHIADAMPTDWSGSSGSYQGSERNSIVVPESGSAM